MSKVTIVPEQSMSLAAATLTGIKFVSEAALSSSAYGMRRATWATGNNPMWGSNGKTPLENARGFIIDQPSEDEKFPEDYELCDAMDVLCAQGKAREVVVEHYDKDGKPNRVASWQLLQASLFVVCEGVPTEQSMRNDPECRWGVAYAPRRSVDAIGTMQSSEVHFVAFIQELMNAGIEKPCDTAYNGPFMFKFSSYIAPKALAVLNAHEYVLRFVNALRADAGEVQGLSYYALAVPIQVSINTITAGTEQSKTKQVHYPVPAIPRLSRNDPNQAIAFLSRVAVTYDQALIIEDNDRVAATSRWSVDFSKKLLLGNVVDEIVASVPDDDGPSSFTDDDIPEGLR